MPPKRATRSQRLLDCLRDYQEIVIIAHDHPDPDAISTGWAVKFLLDRRLNRNVRLVSSGSIVRAENRRLMSLLQPPLAFVDELTDDPNAALVLVDCGPQGTNHLVGRSDRKATAVIDHHTMSKQHRLAFRDIRPNVTASASMASGYLRDQELTPPAPLATALVYAIHSEARGSETQFSRTDRVALNWLSQYADPHLVAEIENAPLAPGYFVDLALALQHTFVYGDTAFCLLPKASGAEIVGEVADLLVRCEGVDRVLCGAAVGGDTLVSVRTTQAGGHATTLVRRALGELGKGGGHARRAGGKIPRHADADLIDKVRAQWLSACAAESRRGRRLVPKRDIVAGL